ncbi:hypothetical protein [Sutcliffiella cohnii]|uniref:hypothetical protein n=1 Tax=Sutcliffiella cohnii TaxID=33932 RepID=UPI0012ECC0DA|nr:hypothetical protein [Sutcliffiella cohnii]
MKRNFLVGLMLVVLLTGCLNDRIVQEAKNKNQSKEESSNEELVPQSSDEEEKVDEITKTIEEALEEIEKDKRTIIPGEFEIKDKYDDETEFAGFVSEQLFKFYNLDLSPKAYYEFLIKHGSTRMKEELEVLNNEIDGIAFLTNIQGLMKDRELAGSHYEITEVELNGGKSEAHFYRKVMAYGNASYYITTIVKENGVWKYLEDSPSPPFDEIDN